MSDAPLSLSPAEEDDLLASEYVLGVLNRSDRAAVDVRLRREPEFAARVAAWEQRLGGMNDDFEAAEAPDLMPQIESRLFPRLETRRTGWLPRVMGLGLATTAALGLAAFLVLSPPKASYTASLTADASPLRYEASVAGDTLTITRVAGDAAETGRVHELWLIAPNAAPVSLGLIDGESLTLPAPPTATGIVLAISLEPSGGSTTGAPTGPVLVTGALIGL